MRDTAQQIFLVRHGETEWSRTGRHTGRTDIPLTKEGEDAARNLGRVLQRRDLTVWTSPAAAGSRNVPSRWFPGRDG